MTFRAHIRIATALVLLAPVAAAAETAAFGCYERIYTADHLAKNPAQSVRRIAVDISKFDGDADLGYRAQAGLIAQFTNDKRQWSAGGGCKAEGDALSCGLDGDAGRAVLKADRAGLRLEIPDYVAFEADAPGGDLDHRAARGPAHRVFLLARADKKACELKN
ncbi:hypothetical protein [Terrarubrum flagellatum]|uniref:hypothetical protein n=1 Tax=Terrirubrum flagellatum TaxID=2895980 RepID=UPI003144D405